MLKIFKRLVMVVIATFTIIANCNSYTINESDKATNDIELNAYVNGKISAEQFVYADFQTNTTKEEIKEFHYWTKHYTKDNFNRKLTFDVEVVYEHETRVLVVEITFDNVEGIINRNCYWK